MASSFEDAIRSQIRSEILCIQPFDELERAHINDALDWINSGAELFRITKPATPPKHLVSYFAVVDDDYILLVDHKNAGLWLPTGGHVETGEHPRLTVAREIQEELGIQSPHNIESPLMITCTYTTGNRTGHMDVSFWYVIHGDRLQKLNYDECEFHSINWFRFDEIPFQRSDPHMNRFIRKLKKLNKILI